MFRQGFHFLEKALFSAFFICGADQAQKTPGPGLAGAKTMSLEKQIEKDYLTAYKAKDTVRVSVLRLLKTSLKRRLVDTSRPGGELSDEETMDIIIKEAKQRRDSITEYNKASRPDLAEKEEAELHILEDYLPKALSDEELAAAIEEMVAKVGAKAPSDMGKVMGPLMKELKGRVDGGRLSAAVKARLAQQTA
jgi:uncharacterized protein